MRKKFTFSSRADVYFLAIMVNCLKKKKCRITLVYLEFKFVPKNEKNKNQKNLIQKYYIFTPKNLSVNECFGVIC